MIKDVDQFREDLHRIGLEETLIEHGISFGDAVKFLLFKQREDIMHETNTRMKGKPRKTDIPPRELYITKSRFYKSWYIRKTVNGKQLSYGSYESLEEAIKVRDKLIENDWNRSKLDDICNELNVNRKRG